MSLYYQFNKQLYRLGNEIKQEEDSSILQSDLMYSFTGDDNELDPKEIESGQMIGNLEVVDGFIQSSDFITGSIGWRISKDGSAEFNTLTISGYIAEEGAAADINAYSTTISGGKITTGSITSLQIQTGTITTSELNFTPLYSSSGTSSIIATINASSEGINIDADNLNISAVTTFSSGWESASNVGLLAAKNLAGSSDLDTTVISGGRIITGLLTADNIQAGTLTGRTVQTASSGSRVVLDGSANEIKLYDASVRRVRGYQQGFDFYNTSTNIVGSIYASSTTNFLIDANAAGVGATNAILYLSAGSTGTIQAHLGTTGSTQRMSLGATDVTLGNIAVGSSITINLANPTDVFGDLTIADDAFLNLAQMTGTVASGLTAQNGSMYYRTDDNVIRVYLNGAWVTITTS